MSNSGFFGLSVSFSIRCTDSIATFCNRCTKNRTASFCFFYGFFLILRGKNIQVISRFEKNIFGMNSTAFYGCVFFRENYGLISSCNTASRGFCNYGFYIIFPLGTAYTYVDSQCIIFINDFICFLFFPYVPTVYSRLHSIECFQSAILYFSCSLERCDDTFCRFYSSSACGKGQSAFFVLVCFLSFINIFFRRDIDVLTCYGYIFPRYNIRRFYGCMISCRYGDIPFNTSHGTSRLDYFFRGIGIFSLFGSDGKS